MSVYQEGHIECPFCVGQDTTCIHCESYVKEVNNIKLLFRSSNLKKKYIDKYCKVNGGKGCKHYRIMSHLYDSGVLK